MWYSSIGLYRLALPEKVRQGRVFTATVVTTAPIKIVVKTVTMTIADATFTVTATQSGWNVSAPTALPGKISGNATEVGLHDCSVASLRQPRLRRS